MELWYSEAASRGAEFRIKIRRPLFSAEREGRRIDVLETEDLGRLLLIDGRIALSEECSDAYREMAVHVPLNVHRRVSSVLVAGGGDGGIVSELVRYPEIERIAVVEPDDGVVEASRRFFPALTAGFSDPRVHVEQTAAGDFVRDTKERFDLIIVDRVENEGPGESSLAQAFYCDSFRILSGDGILVNRAGVATFKEGRLDLIRAAGKLKRLFPLYRLFRVAQPAGCPGELLLGFASKRYDPVKDENAGNWEKRGIDSSYYTPEMHRAAFALPRYIGELLEGI
jgi:spermidine synthase